MTKLCFLRTNFFLALTKVHLSNIETYKFSAKFLGLVTAGPWKYEVPEGLHSGPELRVAPWAWGGAAGLPPEILDLPPF